MTKQSTRYKLFFVATILTLLSGGLAAQEILFPVLPEAKGEQCVEPNEVMRREHFDYLKHTRDETMYKGVRSSKYSLQECISCHVLPDAEGKFVSHKSEKHFCSSCHAFAAVQIDCFECHRDSPLSPESSSASNSTPYHEKAIQAEESLIKSSLKNQLTLKQKQGEHREQ
jgi:hypothetical protein